MNEASSSATLLKGGPVGISSSEPLDSQGCRELQLREVPSQAVRGVVRAGLRQGILWYHLREAGQSLREIDV